MTAAPADPDAPERSLALLLLLFSMLAIVAALALGLVIAVVGFADGGPHDDPLDQQAFEVFGLCLWFVFLAGPGCWIHALVMGTHSWSRHRVTVGATVIPELLLGALAGVAVAFGYLTSTSSRCDPTRPTTGRPRCGSPSSPRAWWPAPRSARAEVRSRESRASRADRAGCSTWCRSSCATWWPPRSSGSSSPSRRPVARQGEGGPTAVRSGSKVRFGAVELTFLDAAGLARLARELLR